MRAYFNMPVQDFTAQLRDIAIRANARPQVIDMIDQLDLARTEEEIADEISEAVAKAEESFGDGQVDMWNQCSDALEDVLHDLELELDTHNSNLIRRAIKGCKP